MIKNGNTKKNQKNKFWKMEKLTLKQFRIVLGIMMFYSFLTLVNMIHFIIQLSAITKNIPYVLAYFAIWFFPPLALIALTYHLLVNVYPPEEKK